MSSTIRNVDLGALLAHLAEHPPSTMVGERWRGASNALHARPMGGPWTLDELSRLEKFLTLPHAHGATMDAALDKPGPYQRVAAEVVERWRAL